MKELSLVFLLWQPTEVTPAARLWLTRALISEAGWRAPADHQAIPWVLRRRWQARGGSFVRTIRAYCQGFRLRRRSMSYRQRWVRALPRLPSPRYREDYARVLRGVNAWADGLVPDPCPEADHWAAPSVRRPRWRKVDCGRTKNVFWKVPRKARWR
jgi:hypothetical protein